jgi:hypothetical protein
MTAILEPPTVTTGSPAPAARPQPVPPPAAPLTSRPPAAPAPPVLMAPEPREKRVLTPTGIRLVGVAMLAMIVAAELLQPAADGAEPVRPVWLETLYTVQTLALLAAAAGFLLGRRWALGSAVLVSGIGAFNVAMCPATGHHVVAGWWFGQVALSAALLALPAAALLRTRAG